MCNSACGKGWSRAFRDRRSAFLQGLSSSLKVEDLLSLHATYAQRSTADNGLIWTTGSIMIPVALGLFGVVSVTQVWWQLLAAAVSSVVLLGVWNLIAENHRVARLEWEARFAAIELAIKLGSSGCRDLKEDWLARLSMRLSVRWIRWILFVVVSFAWAILLCMLHPAARVWIAKCFIVIAFP